MAHRCHAMFPVEDCIFIHSKTTNILYGYGHKIIITSLFQCYFYLFNNEKVTSVLMVRSNEIDLFNYCLQNCH
jgi:hypothetical protein